MNAPACVAIFPATSLMGASRGRRPPVSSTVSYAMHVAPESQRPFASPGFGARWRKANSVCSGRSSATSSGCGSLTFRISSASARTDAESATMPAPCAS